MPQLSSLIMRMEPEYVRSLTPVEIAQVKYVLSRVKANAIEQEAEEHLTQVEHIARRESDVRILPDLDDDVSEQAPGEHPVY